MVEHRLAIQHGLTKLGPELDKFREQSNTQWHLSRKILDAIEMLLQNFAIPLAFISVNKMWPLVQNLEAGIKPEKEDLLSTIVNRFEVEELMAMPGRRFMGKDGQQMAAIVIQSWWRGMIQRKRYQAWRASKLRTGLVALHWLMNAKMARVRRLLQQSRADHLQTYRDRLAALAEAWPRMKNRRRLVIHLPSFGLQQHIRNEMGMAVAKTEHAQLARLCEIRDRLVDSIYISPVRFSADDDQYLAKFLGLYNAIKTGNSAEARAADDRYAIVVPETIGRFPGHSFHNSANLKYSAKSLSRLRALTAGRDAYIVPQCVTWEDLEIAAQLGVPLLGPEPDVARVYGSKSGSHRLLIASCVEMPPSQADIHTIEQIAEALSHLVASASEHLVWLLKIDTERNSRGLAVIDLREYQPARRLVRERARFGDEWYLGWSQEASAQKLQAEFQANNSLMALIKPVCPWAYESSKDYLSALAKYGGTIEAAAPPGSTTFSTDILVEPDGNFQIVASGDQFTLPNQQFIRLGATMPQTSMEPAVINERCRRIAETCRDRGVFGYVSVDFCVLPSGFKQSKPPKSREGSSRPRSTFSEGAESFASFETDNNEIIHSDSLWTTGLKIGYSLQLSMMQMFLFLIEGTFNGDKHRVDSTLIPEVNVRRRLVQPPPKPKQRFACYAYPLRHHGLKSISRTVFFQLCRAHGIGYDVKERCGSAFLLNDATSREELAMMCIADNLPDAVSGAARNLKVLDSEMASPTLSKSTSLVPKLTPEKLPGFMIDQPDNFVQVAQELDHILHTVFANEQIQMEQQALKEAQMVQEMIMKKKQMVEKDMPDAVSTDL